MNRTRPFFIIMGLVYLLISFLQLTSIISLSTFNVFAPSFSALLILTSDLISSVSIYLCRKITIKVNISGLYKQYKLSEDPEFKIINEFNANEINKLYNKHCKKEYSNDKLKDLPGLLNTLKNISSFLFSLAIAVF